jgi:hypothetical protein
LELWFADDDREILDPVRVLIVEDEPKLGSLLRKGSTAQGFARFGTSDGFYDKLTAIESARGSAEMISEGCTYVAPGWMSTSWRARRLPGLRQTPRRR